MKQQKQNLTTIKIIVCNLLLCLILSSCSEQVKVVELQKIEVKIDTIYYYKVERSDNSRKFYDIVRRTYRLNEGDYIQMY